MRGAEMYRDFVPQSEDFCISINRKKQALKGRRRSQIVKNCPGEAPNIVKV